MLRNLQSPGLFALLLGVFALAIFGAHVEAVAAPPRKGKQAAQQFKVGDRAVWEFGSKEYPGTVESIDSTFGWVTLKLDSDDFGGKHRGPPDRLRKIPKNATKAKTSGKARNAAGKKGAADEPDSNPFETSEEKLSKLGPRTWSDQSGKFKIEATLIKFENDEITLKRTDGKEVVLAVTKLSDGDQKFLKERLETPAEGDEAAADEAEEIQVVDASEATPLDVSAGSQWNYQPDSAPQQKLGEMRIALGEKEFFEKPTQLFISPENSKAVIVWLDSFRGKKARVQQCDLKRKKLEKSADFMPGQVPIAMSSDLTRVLATGLDDQSAGALHLYDVEESKLTLRSSWQPQSTERANRQRIETARFVGKDRIWTGTAPGHLVLWNVGDKPEAECQVVKSTGKPAFSAGGKYFALLVEGGIVLLETESGNKAGFLTVEGPSHGVLAFDPAGKQLALVWGTRIRLWDLTTHEMTADFESGASTHDELDWIDENTLLLAGTVVIDVPHRVKTWQYTNKTFGALVGGRYFFVELDKNCVLASGEVPNDDARKLIKSLKPEELLVVKPGGTVKLEVQLDGFPQHRDKVMGELTKQLEANGMHVADDSELKLVVTVKPGEVKKMKFRPIRRPFEIETFSVPTQETSVSYQLKDRTLWSTGGILSAGTVVSKKDESTEDAITRQISEHVAQLGNTRLPKNISVLPEGTMAGTSTSP